MTLIQTYRGHIRRAEERRLPVLGEKHGISWLVLKTKQKVRKLTDRILSSFRKQVLSPCLSLVSRHHIKAYLSRNWPGVKRGRASF